VRLEAARDQYLPVTEELTYRLNAFAGLMPYSASTVPIQERYFLGGDTDMRGFKFHGAGYFDSADNRVPIGGAGKLLAQNELHFPIVDPISGVGFVDVGTLGKNPLSWQAPRASVGTGLRFDLHSVQVALDLALPVVVQTNDQKRYFHFSIQTQF
jgi:outer membrane protein insertion porin family